MCFIFTLLHYNRFLALVFNATLITKVFNVFQSRICFDHSTMGVIINFDFVLQKKLSLLLLELFSLCSCHEHFSFEMCDRCSCINCFCQKLLPDFKVFVISNSRLELSELFDILFCYLAIIMYPHSTFNFSCQFLTIFNSLLPKVWIIIIRQVQLCVPFSVQFSHFNNTQKQSMSKVINDIRSCFLSL